MDVIIKKGLVLVLLGVLFSVACESESSTVEDCDTYNYLDCNTFEPYEAEVALKFTIRDNQVVPFEIIKGKVENGTTIIYDTARVGESEIVYILDIPQYYTVKATYKDGSTTIFAVDGVNLKARDIQKCDSLCWELDDFSLDLTLQE